MGKRGTIKEKDADTTVLYRKSNHNIIQSRTCSGTSDLYTKSGILQIKKRLEQSQNESREKIKRDLSIETDICILRRYCKKKMNRLSLDGSGKSKYSTIVDTEIGTIEEFQPDTSACGDSEPTDIANNILLDTTRIMMDNLKDLLNDWILKHLMSNRDTKTKLETALYSLLHKTEMDKTNTSSSRSTYVLNRGNPCQEVKDKKVATNSVIFKHKPQKKKITKTLKRNSCKDSSCHSSPGSHKIYRIISTLSIPRNLHKQSVFENNGKCKTCKSGKQRNLVLSINKSSKLVDISSFDLLTISTKSFTKQCVNCDHGDVPKKNKKTRQIVFLPNASYKSATDSNEDYEDGNTADKNENVPGSNLDNMPSLVKSLYASDPANNIFNSNTNTNAKYKLNDNFTMTDLSTSLQQHSILDIGNMQYGNEMNLSPEFNTFSFHKNTSNKIDQENPTVTIDFVDNRPTFSDMKKVYAKNFYSIKPHHDAKLKSKKKKKSKTKRNRVLKSRRIRKNPSPKHEKRLDKFINLCQNTFQYFADYEGSNNMKLNIEIKVVPVVDTKNDKYTLTSKHSIKDSVKEKSSTLLSNLEPITLDVCRVSYTEKFLEVTCCSEPENNQEIVPLLDSAASQTKYIFKSRCSTVNSYDAKNSIDRSTITEGEIINDINELKIIVKDIATTAESFVRAHKDEVKSSHGTNKTTSTPDSLLIDVQNTHTLHKQPLLTGIKISKEPRNNVSEFYNRLLRKSTSYNIIDSESVLRVTNMTSTANSFKRSGNSLRRSSSLNEMNSANKSKFLTYYCDECKHRSKFNDSTKSGNSMKMSHTFPKRSWNSKKVSKSSKYMPIYLDRKNDVLYVKHKTCHSLVDSDDTMSMIVCSKNDLKDRFGFNCCNNCDEEKATTICARRITSQQGFFYCFLLWLPVLVVFILFCMVLANKINTNVDNSDKIIIRMASDLHKQNESRFIVRLSDLGF